MISNGTVYNIRQDSVSNVCWDPKLMANGLFTYDSDKTYFFTTRSGYTVFYYDPTSGQFLTISMSPNADYQL